MELADRKANEIKDLLYAQGVRTNRHVKLEVYAAADQETISVSVYRHHYDCEGCRSKGLGTKIMEGLKRGAPSACPQCAVHSESMEFEQRDLLKRIEAVLQSQYTISGRYTGSVVTYLEITV